MIWWIPLVLVVPLFFLWTLIHEGAHALFARIEGHKILLFKPWPHRVDGDWFFGRVVFSGPLKWTIVRTIPYIVDFVVFVFLAIWLWFIGINGIVGTVGFTVLFCPAINTATSVFGRYRQVRPTDLSKVSARWAIPFFLVLYLYFGYIGVLVGRLL